MSVRHPRSAQYVPRANKQIRISRKELIKHEKKHSGCGSALADDDCNRRRGRPPYQAGQ
jgi:hypothetical protein